jgi:molybdopterin-synthase adenylyltransferase
MLTPVERQRYARQMLMFGDQGQEKLKSARVFVAGAGGLGSPVSICLAAAGVGTIRVVDHDVVELTNLNRQVLHGDADIGRSKVDSAADTLRSLNPCISIDPVRETITADNVLSLVEGFDIIVDAMDNIATRLVLNRAALARGIPLVHGAVRGFFGQATTVIPGRTACLRCFLPEHMEKEVFPIVGTTPAVIGAIQAGEVIRCLLGEGELLTNRLLLFEGHRSAFEEVLLERNPRCPACGVPPGKQTGDNS